VVPNSEDVLHAVRRHPGRKTRVLAQALQVAPDELDGLLEVLLRLQIEGEVLKLPREGWTLPEETEFRVGVLRVSRRGGAFLSLSKPEEAGDIRVRPDAIGSAFDGDVVMVRVTGWPRGKRGPARKRPQKGMRREPERPGPRLREGRVVEVLRRSRKLIPGKFWVAAAVPGRAGQEGEAAETTAGFVRPLARHLPTEIYVGPEEKGQARDGDKVMVRLLPGESHGVYPRGQVVALQAEKPTLDSDFLLMEAEFGFPVEHPPAALAEAESWTGRDLITEELKSGRTDLRGLPTFTIDPEDARDFDDAVSLEARPGGGLRLGVHIADVSRYVPSGSALDRSAELRGTSIYLPGRVVPMLPERLSNDLCSLRPKEDRLTKSVYLDFDARGEPAGTRILRSVIRTSRRFNYQEVMAILDEVDRRRGSPASGRAVYPRDRRGREERRELSLPEDAGLYLETVEKMAELRDLLWRGRHARGALDLDIPRLRLRVDQAGQPVAVDREERDPSHHLIEEFMLAANEAVAQYLGEKGLPVVARVHSPPDEERIEDFFHFLEQAGFRLGKKAGSRDLQQIVEETAGEPLAPVIHLALLKSLAHAEYAPAPALHFALATATYCHFTSPIRRYPDLLVHQILDEHLDSKLKSSSRRVEWEAALPEHAAGASRAERRAEEAEREMTKLRLIRFLEPRVGEEMDAMVVSIHPFGFFVRTEELLLEGLVHVSTLGDDFYRYDEDELVLRGERRRGTFRTGDRVRVALNELDPDFRQIGFRFLRKLGRRPAHG
jgi:ribonuclease R